ncbi:hypothetical protein [Paenarthrobacter sp. NPDC057981]|uniref:hypothetical protein n=1 Tax=Paenarthrobacter sp. NPDC057981 TaxID=3346297 RepID=UPI0036DE51DF
MAMLLSKKVDVGSAPGAAGGTEASVTEEGTPKEAQHCVGVFECYLAGTDAQGCAKQAKAATSPTMAAATEMRTLIPSSFSKEAVVRPQHPNPTKKQRGVTYGPWKPRAWAISDPALQVKRLRDANVS